MGNKTSDNLMEAFAGESQANRKYLAFAEQAEKEGKSKVAGLFRTVAEAETIHALKHLKTAGQVQDTKANVKSALEGEIYEFEDMYPGFITEAREEGEKAAARSFELANEAEKAHAGLFRQALAALEAGEDLDAVSFHLCPVCGYIALNEAPENCPVCNAPQRSFKSY